MSDEVQYPQTYRRRIIGVVGPMIGDSPDPFIALFATGKQEYKIASVYSDHWEKLEKVSPEAYAITQRPVIPGKTVAKKLAQEKASGHYIELNTPFNVVTVKYSEDGATRIDWEATLAGTQSFQLQGIVRLGTQYLDAFVQVYKAARGAMPELDPGAVSEVVRSVMWASKWEPSQDKTPPGRTLLTADVEESEWLENLSLIIGIPVERIEDMITALGTRDRKVVSFVGVCWKDLLAIGGDSKEAFELAKMMGLTMLAEKES